MQKQQQSKEQEYKQDFDDSDGHAHIFQLQFYAINFEKQKRTSALLYRKANDNQVIHKLKLISIQQNEKNKNSKVLFFQLIKNKNCDIKYNEHKSRNKKAHGISIKEFCFNFSSNIQLRLLKCSELADISQYFESDSIKKEKLFDKKFRSVQNNHKYCIKN